MPEAADSAIEPSGPEFESDLDHEVLEKRRKALEQVVKFGDPVLRSRASDVTDFGASLRTEVERMIRLMQEGMGIGLAATQLGNLRRLLVFQASPESSPQAIANPQIEWLSEEAEVAEEGCLSLPRVTLDVERPVFARVTGLDQSGDHIEIEAAGLEARVLQHEIDHLNGVLILDRAPSEQKRGALRALRQGESYHPPEDPDGSDAEVA